MFKFNRIYLVLTLILSFVTPLFFITLPQTEKEYIWVDPLKNEQLQFLDLEKINIKDPSFEKKEYKVVFEKKVGLEEQQNTQIIPVSVSTKIIKSGLNWGYLIFLFYLLVSLIFLLKFIVNFLSLFYRISKSKVIEYEGFYLIVNNKTESLYSFWKYIFIPLENFKENISKKELLSHEIAHIEQRHTLDIILVEIVKSIFWFNPVFFLYKKIMQLNHEFLADEEVLKKEKADVKEYQMLILNSIKVKSTKAMVSNFNYLLTKKRLLMMTKKTNLFKACMLQFLSIPFILFLIFVFSNKIYAQKDSKNSELTQEQLEKLKKALVLKDMMIQLKDSSIIDDQKYTDTLTIDNKTYMISTSKGKLKKIFKEENKKIPQKELNKIFINIDVDKVNQVFEIREIKNINIQKILEQNNKQVDNFNKYVAAYFNSKDWKDKRKQIEKETSIQTDLIKVDVSKPVNKMNNINLESENADKRENNLYRDDMEEFKIEMRKFKEEMKQLKQELKSLNRNL